MAFELDIKEQINNYVSSHLATEDWHSDYFSFVSDASLAKRLGEEFISARYIYKLLEGLEADDWLLRAQIRVQVLSYASIYEAVLHHILFTNLAMESSVISLTEFPTKKQVSIPTEKLALLEKNLEHDGKKIIPCFETVGKTNESKVRFDKKAECAQTLGLIEPWLKEELVEFYEARNAIHIHAEIKKEMNYQLDLSKRAYRRMKPFKEQIEAWFAKRS